MRVKIRSTGPDDGGRRRDETAGAREQDDQRGLAHVGRLSAHVRAGDHQHAPRRVEIGVVRHEWRARLRFDDQVASRANVDAGDIGQLGRDQAQCVGAVGERGQHIEGGDRFARGPQRRAGPVQAGQQVVVEFPFPAQRARLARQRLVLELFQRRRDVAFRILQCLPADVLGGDVRRRRAVGLDVVAMHAVVADLERRDPGAFALADFQLGKETAGVLREIAQAVELPIESARDDAAFAQRRRRLIDHGAA